MGNLEATRLLIESGADLAIRNSAGKTALHYIILNCPEAVVDFLDRGIGHTLNTDHCNILHTAATSGNMQATFTLLNTLPVFGNLTNAINALDDQKRTPLHYTVESGFTEIVESFLKYRIRGGLEDSNLQQAGELAAARSNLPIMKLFISSAERITGCRFLQVACGAGQALVVEYLLRNQLVSPDGDGSNSSAPILLATLKGHNEMVRILLRYNASVKIVDTQRKTPLHHVAETGNCYLALMLFQHQANANAQDIKRNTPLHSAAKSGQVRVIKLLLEYGADIKARSRIKETALHLAVKNPESVEYLLGAGADRCATDMLGQTPLHMAALQKCYKSANLLISDAGIAARDEQGRLPLFFAIENDDLEIIDTLCKDRHNLRDSQEPVLEWAVEFSALKVLRFLFDRSSGSINKADNYGRRLIHKAAEKESLEVLIFLLDSGADVNGSDDFSRTPLHNAAKADCAQAVQKLIESSAKINDADEDGWTPLHLAAHLNNVEALAVLLQACADPNVRDSRQRTPLYLAVESADADAIGRLLEKNANPNLADHKGWSPLHAAAGNPETTMMLLAHKANVDIQEQGLKTPLHLAMTWETWSTTVAKLLLENRANPNLADGSGDTALHLAIMGPSEIVIQLMLDSGADFKINRRDGRSCLDLAIEHGLASTFELLLDAGSCSASGTKWDFEDLVAAYWLLIKKCRVDKLWILVNKERQLLDELSSEGFTGLKTCLRHRGDHGEEEQIAIYLLKFSTDPFQRRQENQKSAFELGIISRRTLKQRFINACIKRVSEDISPTTSDLGFKEL